MTEIISHTITRMDEAHKRLDVHEQRIGRLETHMAVETERSRHIQASLDDIRSSISWVIRLVLGGIIAAAMAFVIGGGLNGVH
ncbi:hemolysin XhlA family protein [Tistrella bauzanensis]|uniref:hemolysin XhlA family protein n=1 Tax=Tistrella TaxID=171436 RepID=UPI0031F6662F